jgi:hypothetical protein
LSPSVDLEIAQQEGEHALARDKRLLREGSDVVLLSNQKGNYYTDSYKDQMHVYLDRTSEEMHINSDLFRLSDTKRLYRNAVLHPDDDVAMMWQTCNLITK